MYENYAILKYKGSAFAIMVGELLPFFFRLSDTITSTEEQQKGRRISQRGISGHKA